MTRSQDVSNMRAKIVDHLKTQRTPRARWILTDRIRSANPWVPYDVYSDALNELIDRGTIRVAKQTIYERDDILSLYKAAEKESTTKMSNQHDEVRQDVLNALKEGSKTYADLACLHPTSILNPVLDELFGDFKIGVHNYSYYLLGDRKPATPVHPAQPTLVGSKLVVEIDEEAPPHLIKIGELQVGETFSFQVGRSPKNVYMVLREDEYSRAHSCVRTVLLTTGATYYEKADRSVRRRACVLKVAP